MFQTSGTVGSGPFHENPKQAAFRDTSTGAQYRVSESGKGYRLDFERTASGSRNLGWFVGSGRVARSYIFALDGFLFQSPLSYYSLSGKWDLSPGYETMEDGFNRPISSGCISCHSGRPQPVMNRPGLFRNPAFLELGIGCENCHGPGQIHVSERSRGLAVKGNFDNSIVNPARLPARLAEDICMGCHQDGDARVLQPGKDYTDFRPGTPLNDIFALFKIPLKRGRNPTSSGITSP